ncbi:MAG: PKD domain-containing protein [Microthrixaceae bacterium]
MPIARITTNPTPATGNAPLAVAFSGSTSTVADSPGTYLWTFGDGASATGVNVSHTYTAPGNYTATLKVTDSNSDSSTANVVVKVNDPTPPATQDTVSVLFGGSVNYQNSGGGTGNIGVAHDAFGLVSVSGYLDVPSKVSGTARVTVNVNRLWILPIWTGTITVNDQAAGINQATPMLSGVNTSVTPRTARLDHELVQAR